MSRWGSRPYVTTLCSSDRHAACAACDCRCHDEPMPADFRAQVAAERRAVAEADDEEAP